MQTESPGKTTMILREGKRLNKSKILGLIRMHGETCAEVAKSLGMSASRFSAKLNGWNGAEFSRLEIEKIKTRYGLTPKEVDEIFFANE